MKTTDILTYKRTEEKTTEHTPEILLAVMGVLAGRVELWGTVMPTGISWVIANLKSETKKQRLIVAIIVSAMGMILGGVDVFRMRGLITLGVLYAASRFDIFGKNTMITAVFGASVNLVCGLIIMTVTHGDSLGYIMLIIECMLILGASVAFDSFIAIAERGGSILSEDEGISLFVVSGVIAAGFSGLELAGIRLCAIISMYMIIFASRKCGLGIAVTLGTILAVVTGGEDPVSTLGLYIFLAIGCSLLASIGKWGIIIGAAIANTVYIACRMGLDSSVIRVIEIGTAAALFYFTPDEFINKVAMYTAKKTLSGMGESRLIRQRQETDTAVLELKNAISAVAETVKEMDLQREEKESQWEIIKKVNNSVCSSCALYKYCIEKNRVRTEQAIGYIIQLFREKGDETYNTIMSAGEKNVLEKAFMWNCIHTEKVVEKVKDSFEFYLRQEFESEKQEKTREFTIKGLEYMAEIIDRQRIRLKEFCTSYEQLAEEISCTLVRNGICCFGVCVIKNRCGLFEVTAEIDSRFPGEAERIIKGIMGISMKTIFEEKTEKGTVLSMREKEHFEYETAVMSLDSKEMQTGDSTLVFNDEKGYLHCMISDGMGSGILAATESGWTVKLYEKLCRGGFEPHEALIMINNVMISGKQEESCVSCDSVKVNLLTGAVEFTKAGAAASYIKTKKGVEKVEWSSLPLGIIEIGGIETRLSDVSDGGFIVLMSDGVPDSSGDRLEGEHKLSRALKQCDGETPGEIAESLMFASMAMGVPKDDMTVLVIKLQKVNEPPLLCK